MKISNTKTNLQKDSHKHEKKHFNTHNTKQSQKTKNQFVNFNKEEKQALLEEIQDLELQILDMFEVAFHFAGLQEEYLEEALQYYMQIMDDQDDSLEYTPQIIIENMLQIKQNKPEWFL